MPEQKYEIPKIEVLYELKYNEELVRVLPDIFKVASGSCSCSCSCSCFCSCSCQCTGALREEIQALAQKVVARG